MRGKQGENVKEGRETLTLTKPSRKRGANCCLTKKEKRGNFLSYKAGKKGKTLIHV